MPITQMGLRKRTESITAPFFRAQCLSAISNHFSFTYLRPKSRLQSLPFDTWCYCSPGQYQSLFPAGCDLSGCCGQTQTLNSGLSKPRGEIFVSAGGLNHPE